MTGTIMRSHLPEVKAEFTIAGQRITWVCAGCRQPIRTGTGYLEADDETATEITAVWRRFFDEHADGFDSVELMALPDTVPWLAHHEACDPNPEDDGYCIAVERIGTTRQLLHWAGHLMAAVRHARSGPGADRSGGQFPLAGRRPA